MRLRKASKIVLVTVILYLVFPVIAGSFAIGDRDGPKIYPVTYHTMLYMISYEALRDEKPRQSYQFDRPWFYGLPRRQRQITSDNEQ